MSLASRRKEGPSSEGASEGDDIAHLFQRMKARSPKFTK